MMFGFYARTIDEAIVRPFWAIRIWAHRHPVPFRILATIILTSFMIGWPTIAFAADDSPMWKACADVAACSACAMVLRISAVFAPKAASDATSWGI